ncbi:Crp/Fnr family transcriptional regulator (plasmid) [Roseomonas sp. OT10]|uniref:Crp/Fnr family transcriptional regulator n=1 Tax=Roseomonas cutis TaxID=2897332 RepID=UPI001E28F382|nr:Crp/Fnr family transcriptional regulator [Roseomonas sp. OT10]UFN51635.1 Crp/Fnr family transcriptional regulator [Roseomonas sp. OT10]
MAREGDPAFLGRTPLFRNLSDEALEAIAATATPRLFRAGQIMFLQGHEPSYLHLLVRGWVKISHGTPGGDALTIRVMEPGDVPGCVAVFRRTPYPATATAIVDSQVLAWAAETFASLLKQHPGLARNALDMVGGRTEEMLQRLREFAMEPVERRIARVLLRLVGQAGQPAEDGTEVGFPLSRQDIAEMAGTTLHTVSRTLRAWERCGLVSGGRQRVAIRDGQALRAIAGRG